VWRGPDGLMSTAVRSLLADGTSTLAAGAVLLSLPMGEGGMLGADPDGRLTLRGAGYMPFSLVTFSLFSEPTDLGEVQADRSGSFEVSVLIPASAGASRHTLRISGVDSDGAVIVLDVGVSSAGASPLPADGPADRPADSEPRYEQLPGPDASSASEGGSAAAGVSPAGGSGLPSGWPMRALVLLAVSAVAAAVIRFRR
jgi:hypothetical protein